jgi:hypothetical protein
VTTRRFGRPGLGLPVVTKLGNDPGERRVDTADVLPPIVHDHPVPVTCRRLLDVDQLDERRVTEVRTRPTACSPGV